VGTARRFQPPLYIHTYPYTPVVVRHSSQRPLCIRCEERAILRSCNCRVAFARRCVEFVRLSRGLSMEKCTRRAHRLGQATPRRMTCLCGHPFDRSTNTAPPS